VKSQAALFWISKVQGYDHVWSWWSAQKIPVIKQQNTSNDFSNLWLLIEKENNIRLFEDIEFLFLCSTQYLMSELSEWMRYQLQQERRKSTSPHSRYYSLDNNIVHAQGNDKNQPFPKVCLSFLKIEKI